METITVDYPVRRNVQEQGYSFVTADRFLFSEKLGASWRNLVEDWEDLRLDTYMKDGGRYRLRRYGRFLLMPSVMRLTPLPPAPYYQTTENNPFAGGINREFAPLRDGTVTNHFLRALIQLDFQQFNVDSVRLESSWVVGIHQFRILAQAGVLGKPTPEGIHQDGNEIFAVHLIARNKIQSGTSRIYSLERNLLEEFTLLNPLDSYYIEDARVMHEVTPIEAEHG